MKNCQETTLEMERSNFERLSFKDRLLIKVHCLLCPPCRNYFNDSKSIDKILSMKFTYLDDHKFSEEEKLELKKKLSGH